MACGFLRRKREILTLLGERPHETLVPGSPAWEPEVAFVKKNQSTSELHANKNCSVDHRSQTNVGRIERSDAPAIVFRLAGFARIRIEQRLSEFLATSTTTVTDVFRQIWYQG
jgi:hypothetical protein